MANILASLVVKIGADVTGVTAGMNVFEQRARKLQESFKSVAAGSATIAAAAAATGTALVAMAVKTGEYADRLLDLKDQTGLTTTELQRFRAVAMQAGVGADTIAEAVIKLQTRMASGAEGSADMRAALDQLGIGLTEAGGRSRDMGSIMTEAIGKLASMDDVTQRNVTAVKLFGRGAKELLPVLGLTSAEMQGAIDRAERLGIIMSEDALDAANKFRIEWGFLKEALAGTQREIAVDVIPALTNLTATLTDNGAKIRAWANFAVEAFKIVGEAIAAPIRIAFNLGTMIGELGNIMWSALRFDVNGVREAMARMVGDFGDVNSAMAAVDEGFDRLRIASGDAWAAMAASDQVTPAIETAAVATGQLADETLRLAEVGVRTMTNQITLGLPVVTAYTGALTAQTVAAGELDDASQGMVSTLSSGFANAITQGQNFAQAMHQMAQRIIRDLIRVAIQGALTRAFLGVATGGVGFLGGLFGGGGVPGRASGGPVSAGSPYMVGERGPELFVPRSSGSIVPNGQGGGGASASAIVDLAFRRMPAPPTASSPQEMARDRYWRQFGAELVTALKHDGVRFA